MSSLVDILRPLGSRAQQVSSLSHDVHVPEHKRYANARYSSEDKRRFFYKDVTAVVDGSTTNEL